VDADRYRHQATDIARQATLDAAALIPRKAMILVGNMFMHRWRVSSADSGDATVRTSATGDSERTVMKRGYGMTRSAQAGAQTAARIAPPAEGQTPDTSSEDGAQPKSRRHEGRGHFDARAIREMLKTAGADPKSLRRTIRRTELRQIVPLADSTIYEMERRGEFPQRFFLTPRCVVWDLAEVMAWLEGRRRGGDGGVKKAPAPDYRLRTRIR
jgi:prophage regulatory protein